MTSRYDTILHRWFEEVWNKGRADVIDELLATDVTIYGLVDSGGNEVRGVKAFKSFYESFRQAFPDILVIVEDTVAEGDKIVARCAVKATHTGDGLGVAGSGNRVEFSGMCWVRVKDGRIVESWNSFDFLTMMQQTGLVSLPAK
jgi:steroid delta-isomerase-like uncharacterized protein